MPKIMPKSLTQDLKNKLLHKKRGQCINIIQENVKCNINIFTHPNGSLSNSF